MNWAVRYFLVTLIIWLAAAPVHGAEEPLQPSQNDRCPVCGMYVAAYPNWITVITFKDGSREFFDGPKDMFTYFFSLPEYRESASPENVEGLWVTEYYTLKRIRAEEAFFISGSNVLGPMGKEIVPVQGREEAETFMHDHHGQKVFRFHDGELEEVHFNR